MNAIQNWVQKGLPIAIRKAQLSPVLKDKNICIKEGAQGTTYQLVQKSTGKEWLIKKFHHHSLPSRKYLESIRKLLPDDEIFVCAKKRMILTNNDLKQKGDVFYSGILSQWLDDCVLMQKVPGNSWREVSDKIRSGKIKIAQDKRMRIAKKLAEAVYSMEENGCSHRDLSHENICVDISNDQLFIVDWDSLYHESLAYEKNTTLGSPGYLAPWVVKAAEKNINEAKKITWNSHADRFTLGILIAEFMLIEKGTPTQKEGVLFSKDLFLEDEHPEVALKVQEMYNISEGLGDLFRQCVTAKSNEECPMPAEWVQIFDEYVSDVEYEDSATSIFSKSSDALIKYGRKSSDTLKKYGKTAHRSYLRVKYPMLLTILCILVILLILPWLLLDRKDNSDKDSISQRENPQKIISNNNNENNTNHLSTPTTLVNIDEDNFSTKENQDDTSLTKNEHKNENLELATNETNNISPEIIENDPHISLEDNNEQSSNSKETNVPAFQEITDAKKYYIKILYSSNDLEMSINNKKQKIDKKNKSLVYVSPGVYPVKISFSAISLMKNGTTKILGKTSFTENIDFTDKQNITIRIDRVGKKWKIIN